MPRAQFQQPHAPNKTLPNQDEPEKLPVEPDEGPVPAVIPDDPQQERSPNPVMAQARRDIDAGLVDTDMRATAGLSAKRRAHLVPGPAGKPPSADA